MPKTLKPREITRRDVQRLLQITGDAAYRGDIKAGFIVVEWKGGETTAQVYIDYESSWTGKAPHYEYGDWVDSE